jgi:hypothetical protein
MVSFEVIRESDAKVLGVTLTEHDASVFIEQLPGYELGLYGIDAVCR